MPIKNLRLLPRRFQKAPMQDMGTIVQIEGLTAPQIFEALKLIESQITELKDNLLDPKPSAPTGYLTREDVCKLLKISLPTLNDWTNKGLLKAYRLGKRVFFKLADIDAAMHQIPARRGREVAAA